MSRSEMLEREAEARRLELARTFEELRTRATPGNMVNQFVDLASDSGGADMLRNLRTRSVNNPLAVGLVGAGLAWLMMSGLEPPVRRRGLRDPSYDPAYDDPEVCDALGDDESAPSRTGVRRYLAGARERAGDALGGAQHLVSDAAHSAGGVATEAMSGARSLASGTVGGIRSGISGAAHMASRASGAAGSIASSTASLREQARDRARDRASAVYGSLSDTADRTASGVRAFASGTTATGRDVMDVARDQPLIVASLGLALGAAMAAMFRSTETERQMMGETSDTLKERTHALASRTYDESRAMAGAIYDELQERMRDPGSRTTLPRTASPESRDTRIVRISGDDDIEGPGG